MTGNNYKKKILFTLSRPGWLAARYPGRKIRISKERLEKVPFLPVAPELI
jgi:hypothetical protein